MMAEKDFEKELILITQKFLLDSNEPFNREIQLNFSLEGNLGIDSLGRAELFKRVEKQFNVDIPDRLLAEAETLQDILTFLQHGTSEKHLHKAPRVSAAQLQKSTLNMRPAKSLLEVLEIYAHESKDKPHIFFQNESGKEEIITYGELMEKSMQVAFSLRELKLKPGETVAIMQPTQPGFFYSFFGTLLAGGVPVPIYPPFRMHMLEAYTKTEAHILRNAEVRVLITFDQAERFSHLLKNFVPSLKHVVTVEDLLNQGALAKPFLAKENDYAFIQYTSGSTSAPKGVLLTHYNLLTNIRAYGDAIHVTPDDVAVSWLPLYHDMGLIGLWLGSLYFGIPLILLTPFTFLNHPERWLWAIHYHKGSLTGAPNFAYELCLRKIDHGMLEGLDLSSWRVAANGAEKIYPRTLEKFAEKFAPYGFKRKALLPVYGLAESTVALTIPPYGSEFHIDHVDRKHFEEECIAQVSQSADALPFVGCGVPMKNHEVRIVNDDNQPLPERHVGGLQFRGPSSMQGYYQNPQATAAIYHDGWFDSGDLAYIADGEVFITGRRKDLIIKAGRNIYPAEIEELVGNVAAVREGCVIAFGITNLERATEQLIVVAETREKNPDAQEQIKENIKAQLATHLDIVADHIVLVAPHIVPKTSSGKLQRAACKKMYLEGKLSRKEKSAGLQVVKLGFQSSLLKAQHFLGVVGKLFYTTYVAIIFVLSMIPMYLVLLLGSRHFAAKFAKAWANFLEYATFCKPTVIQPENLNSKKPVIFAANHASYVDSFVVLALLPPGTAIIGKKELLRMPVVKKFISKLNFPVVDRMDFSKGIEDVRAIQAVLQAGNSIMIFPEGTFGYAQGLRPFRLGAFKLAAETHTPICPISIQGTRTILRDEEKLMRPHPVKITVHAPIMPSGKEWEDVIKLRDLVRTEIAKDCGEPTLDFIVAQKVAKKLPKA